MSRTPPHQLSRRERQLMDVVYARNEASASDIHAALPDAPSYSAVRALLAILVEKGHLKRRLRAEVGRSALRRVLDTFFEGSLEKAVAALLQGSNANLSEEELQRLGQLIQQARKEGR
jgi:BlaI family penicillinase repressor